MPKNSISTNKFINPYHFVNLPNQKAQYQEEKEEQRYTGKINVRITTKTPLFIPNTSCDDAFEMNREVEGHKSYDFFSYNKIEPNKNNPCNEPVIPGSAIRGMIRSVYETLTGSCMAIVDDEKTLSKRINVYFDLGLIGRNENGQLVLYQIRKERIKK